MQSAASRERGRALLAGVSGLMRRAERRAWASWRDAVHERELQRRAVARWDANGVLRALAMWRESAAASSATARRLSAAAALFTSSGRACSWAVRQWAWVLMMSRDARSALASWTLLGLRRGVASWVAHASSRRVAQVAAAALMRQGLRRAMNAWVATARQRAEAAEQLRRGAEHMLGHAEGRAFRAWADSLTSAVDDRARAAQHWTRREVSAAWAQWCGAAAVLSVLSSAVSRLRGRDAGRAVCSWRSYASLRREAMAAVARSAAVLLRREVALGMRAWRLLHEERARQHSVMMGVVAQLQGLGVRRAWQSWRWAASEARRLLTLMGRATRAESAAMARWQARAAALKLLRRALAWTRRQAESRALRSWAVQSAASRERGRVLLAGVSGLKRRAERRAWASWRDAVGRTVWCMFNDIYHDVRFQTSGFTRVRIGLQVFMQ